MTASLASDPFTGPDVAIGKACNDLIAGGQKITLRAVADLLGLAHTSLSRNIDRRTQIERAQAVQKLADRIDKTRRGHIKPGEQSLLARAYLRIEDLEAEKALLVASHRAVLMALGECGGMQAWMNFFEKWPPSLESFVRLGAIPDNLAPLPVKGKRS